MTICRTYCIQILREFLYFQSWNWEKNFEVCTLQRTISREMVYAFIFGINTCMQKDRKKGTGVKLCTINVLSLLSLRSIWTGRMSSAAASASWFCDSISVPLMSLSVSSPSESSGSKSGNSAYKSNCGMVIGINNRSSASHSESEISGSAIFFTNKCIQRRNLAFLQSCQLQMWRLSIANENTRYIIIVL